MTACMSGSPRRYGKSRPAGRGGQCRIAPVRMGDGADRRVEERTLTLRSATQELAMNIRIRYAVLGLAFAAATLPAAAAGSGQFKDLLNKVKSSSHGSNASLGSNLPTSDIASGLKEALAKGTTNAINSLGRAGGFWNNPKVRIPLPGKVEQ